MFIIFNDIHLIFQQYIYIYGYMVLQMIFYDYLLMIYNYKLNIKNREFDSYYFDNIY